MNNSIKSMMQFILTLALPIAISACAKEDASISVSTVTPSSCTEILSEIDKQALSNAHKPLDEYFKSRIEMAKNLCPTSFQRDFSIAQLLAASEEYDEAINLLNGIVSTRSEDEIQRLHLLFWIYISEVNRDKVTEVVSAAISNYPDNPYTLIMLSVNNCFIGSCKNELNQLIKLDKELFIVATLPFLAQAYAENNDYKNASITFDKAINLSGISGLSDKKMYIAVISNLNIQHDENAKSIYIQYTQANPNVNTAYVNNAKAALDSLGLLDNELN